MKYNLLKNIIVTLGVCVFVLNINSYSVNASKLEETQEMVAIEEINGVWEYLETELWKFKYEDGTYAYDKWIHEYYVDVDGKWIPDKEKEEAIDLNSWMLTLVNLENPLSADYVPSLAKLSNGLMFDARAIDQLNAMIADAKAQGLSPIICSAYRTIDRQETLYINQVYKQKKRGFNQENAEEEARKRVAYPSTSEHNLGLAVDIVAQSYQLLSSKQEETKEMQWLIENCSNYGFILRYPKDKTEVTGIIYEPWHFRYVGVEAAKEIMKKGLCLEEYYTIRKY
mgnify:CR=1 FL=1